MAGRAEPVSALDSDNGPENTVISSAPTLFAKVRLKPSTGCGVVDNRTSTLEIIESNGSPASVSGRNIRPEMLSGSMPNSEAS